ncbi:MAG: toxin-antitoxin system YwqK family antitoxin, partial [Luteibaculum sp.]
MLISLAANKIFAQQGLKTEGYNKLYYENGKLASEGFSKDGKPEGYWKTYYQNGQLKSEGSRKNFQLEGIWKFYDSDGNLSSEITYEEGKKNGPNRIY